MKTNKDNNIIYVISGCFVTDGDYLIDLNKFEEEYRKYISYDDCLEEYEINLVTDDFYLARDFLKQLITSFYVIYTHHYILLDLVKRVTKIYDCLMNHKETNATVYYCGNYDGTKLSINKINKQNLKQDDIDELLGTNKILTKEEKNYLKAVIKPFRNGISYIVKRSSHYTEWLYFYTTDFGYDASLHFPKGKLYTGMEVDKKYTLEELGL